MQKLRRTYFIFLLFLPLTITATGTLDVYWVDVEGGAGSFAALKGAKSIQAMWQVHKNLRQKDPENNTIEDYIANLTDRDGCKGHYLKLSVAADGKTYNMSNPRNGQKVTYQTKKR